MHLGEVRQWSGESDQVLRRVLAVVVLLAALAWGVLGALQGVQKITQGSTAAAVQTARERFAWDTCIAAAIRTAVPDRVSVWIPQSGKVYWWSSLGPMSAPEHEVLTDPEVGAYSLRVTNDVPGAPRGIHCPGRLGTKYPPIVLVARVIKDPAS